MHRYYTENSQAEYTDTTQKIVRTDTTQKSDRVHRYYIENIDAECTDTTLNLRLGRKVILFLDRVHRYYTDCHQSGNPFINNSVIFYKNYANVVGKKERERERIYLVISNWDFS